MDREQEEVFMGLLKENEEIVQKVSRFYIQDEEERKDLFQEIVLQLWKAFPSFKGKSKFTTWMYRVALNTALTNKKKLNKKTVLSYDNTAELPADRMIREEQVQILYKQIHQLNDIEKAVMLLYLDEFKYDEIAEMTGLTATNVSTRISRIKQKITEAIIKNYKIY